MEGVRMAKHDPGSTVSFILGPVQDTLQSKPFSSGAGEDDLLLSH